jgi:uncharacterized protein YdiU (UPF0061 family)
MQSPSPSLAGGYSKLPEHFFARLDPTPVAQPRLIQINRPLAAELGLALESLDDDALAAIFAGNRLLPGAEPIAMAYAGHQFGFFSPQLGDGRAILLGEVRDVHGLLRDIQLKGSGRTPYSRSGDGRAALGPVLREYLVSEAMFALGIPATRALAAVATGENVYRDQPLPGAILTRVAASHVRVGTFQYFASRGDVEATRRLADYVIERHYPEVATSERPYLDLLAAVTLRQAALIARWLHVGFIHGVMNTDNMAISGETIDFGPCAFMEAYDPATVFSSIDGHGRYAYANQVHAGQWNLARFAETLLPLIDPVPERAIEPASAVVSGFAAHFAAHWLEGMRAKLGLVLEESGDADLVQALLAAMQANQADFTLTFRHLATEVRNGAADPVGAADPSAAAEGAVRGLFAEPAAYDAWARQWHARLSRDAPLPAAARAAAMARVNPVYIPRNHWIERAIVAATSAGDFGIFRDLLAVLAHPYEAQPGREEFERPSPPEERVTRTFCGT